jgi:hypothetical protein
MTYPAPTSIDTPPLARIHSTIPRPTGKDEPEKREAGKFL